MIPLPTDLTAVAAATPRPPRDRAPDLLHYRLVHRAMAVDPQLLTTVADELVERPDPARGRSPRRYLLGAAGEVRSHLLGDQGDPRDQHLVTRRDRQLHIHTRVTPRAERSGRLTLTRSRGHGVMAN